MKVQYSDNAATVLNAPVEAGHEVLIVASASAFPILVSGDWMYVTVEEEVVKVTNTSGNVFTCEAFNQAHGTGASVQGRITTGLLEDGTDADVYDSANGMPVDGTMRKGEIFANCVDIQIGIGNGDGNPVKMVAVRYHSSFAKYYVDDMVAYGDNIWICVLEHTGSAFVESMWEAIGSDVESIVGTTNEIDVDNTDPTNPVLSIPNSFKPIPNAVPIGTLITGGVQGLNFSMNVASPGDTIDIGKGGCWDSLGTTWLTLAADTTVTIGSPTVDTVYKAFLTDAGDIQLDTDVDGATLLAGAVNQLRLIGFAPTDGSGVVIPFVNNKDSFTFVNWLDANIGTASTSYVQFPLAAFIPVSRCEEIAYGAVGSGSIRMFISIDGVDDTAGYLVSDSPGLVTSSMTFNGDGHYFKVNIGSAEIYISKITLKR